MRRLAILVAVLATVHVAETVVTQERVVRVRTVWNGWTRDVWGRVAVSDSRRYRLIGYDVNEAF